MKLFEAIGMIVCCIFAATAIVWLICGICSVCGYHRGEVLSMSKADRDYWLGKSGPCDGYRWYPGNICK